MTTSPLSAGEGSIPGRWRAPLLPVPEGLERLGVRLGIVGFWALLGGLETAKELVVARAAGGGHGLSATFLVNFGWWFFWAPATFVIVWLARSAPLGSWAVREPRRAGPPLPVAVSIHAVAAAGFALAQLSTVGAVSYLAVIRGGEFTYDTLTAQIRFWLQGYLVLSIFTYWMIVGGYHAFLFHRRLLKAGVRQAELEARAARAEMRAVEARLHALGRELNPHFLFNALNGVSGLVEAGRGPDAQTMLARISRLLRSTLHLTRRREIPLSEELATVEEYLSIERIRFGDRLTTRVDAALDVADALVPPLLLQPLAENGIRHGVARAVGPGWVEVRARRVGGELRIEIEDSGPGPVPLDDSEEGAGEGVGLRNARARLEEMYDGEGELEIGEGSCGGCRVTLRLPYHVQGAGPA